MRREAVEKMVEEAKRVGCKKDQVKRFLQAGYIPQPKQLKFHAVCRLADEDDGPTEIGFGGARGPGKTHGMFAQIAIDDCHRVDGLRCLLLRKVGKSIRETIEHMRNKVLSNVPHEWVASRSKIVFPNGSSIVMGHFQKESDIDGYLGLEYDIIGVEEATTLTFSKYMAVRTICRSSLRGWRPRVYLSTNPGNVGHAWFKTRFVEPHRVGKETWTRFVPATAYDNMFLNKEYRENVLGQLTGWKKRAWLGGDWDIQAGQFFSTFSTERHVLTPPYPSLAKYKKFWASLDYGFTHKTSVHVMGMTYNGDIHVMAEHARNKWSVARHSDAIMAILMRRKLDVSDLSEFVAGGDAFAKGKDSDARTVAQQYEKHGIYLTRANMRRIAGASEILHRLGDEESRPTVYIYDSCVQLIECIPRLEHDPNRPEDVLKVDADPETGEGGDDLYDSFRYGIMVGEGQSNSGGIMVEDYAAKAPPVNFLKKRRI